MPMPGTRHDVVEFVLFRKLHDSRCNLPALEFCF